MKIELTHWESFYKVVPIARLSKTGEEWKALEISGKLNIYKDWKLEYTTDLEKQESNFIIDISEDDIMMFTPWDYKAEIEITHGKKKQKQSLDLSIAPYEQVDFFDSEENTNKDKEMKIYFQEPIDVAIDSFFSDKDNVEKFIAPFIPIVEDWYTPRKGVDYDDWYTPIKGKDYFDWTDGETPKKGIDYFTNKEILEIKKALKKSILEEMPDHATKEEVNIKFEDILKKIKNLPKWGGGALFLRQLMDVNVWIPTAQQYWLTYSPSRSEFALTPITWGGGWAVDSVNSQTGVVVLDQDDIGDGTTYKQYSATEKTKLAGIETGAEVNTIDTVSDTSEIDLTITARALSASIVAWSIDETKLDTSVNASLDLADSAVQPAGLSGYQLTSQKDSANGYAGLDAGGKINSAQIPDIAISDFLGNFTDTTAALANAGVQASQKGDWFTVDTSGGQSWIVTTSLPTTLADITQLKTPTDAVTSVFSRTWNVVSANGDYTASQITNVAAWTIAAITVQAAIDELDTEKGGLAVANIWAAAQSFFTNTSGQQIFLGTTSGWFGYWIGRNSSTGFLDFVGTQGGPFDGIQCAVLRASSSITINGENVIRNWSSTLWLGSGSGTPWAILEVRWWTQDFMIGGGSGTSYVFQRNPGTGFMEITGQQAGYTGYIISTGNGSNALTINDTGNSGFGVAIGSIGAKVHIIKTTEQLRVGYDASNYYSTTVGSAGGVTFDAVGSGAGFTFSDPVLNPKLVEANTAGSGSPNIITSAESATVFTNEWATALNYHTLPTAVAWLTYTFYVDDADWIRVVANTGDIIQINGVASASAWYTECTAIGGCITLVAINATDWVATSVIWTWTLT